jgi:hypothetical protein
MGAFRGPQYPYRVAVYLSTRCRLGAFMGRDFLFFGALRRWFRE